MPHAATCLAAGCRGPSSLGLPGVLRRWVRPGGLVVSGSVSTAVGACVLPAAGAHRARRYPSLACARPPWLITVRFSHGVPPLHVLPCGRLGGGGAVLRLWGSVSAGEKPGVAGLCSTPPFAIRGSVHRAPGHCLGLRPRSPPAPVLPLACGPAQYSAAGGGGGRAACRALCRGNLHLFSVWRSWALRAAARVSGQRARRALHCRARPCVARRRHVPTWRYPLPRARWRCGPQGPGSRGRVQLGRLPPTRPGAQTAQGGCMPKLRGPWPSEGSTLGRSPAPAQPAARPHTPFSFCVRQQGSSAQPTGRSARLPAGRRRPSRPLAPSLVGCAITCGSTCVGAGAAAVAGSPGGRASG